MTIGAYSELSEQQLREIRYTSGGKTYNLNHPEGLTLSMRYKGVGASGANSQGWERNSHRFFSELAQAHPEYFSKKNINRIKNNKVPKVDAQFAASFPKYAQFKGERLIHHHVGRDGQAVAIPNGMHTGQGEIHQVEDALGVTEKASRFSEQCAKYCKAHPSYINQKSSEFGKAFKTQTSAVSAASSTKWNAFLEVKRVPNVEGSRVKQAQAVETMKSNAFSQHAGNTKAIRVPQLKSAPGKIGKENAISATRNAPSERQAATTTTGKVQDPLSGVYRAESKKSAAPSRSGAQSRGNAFSGLPHTSRGGVSKAVRSSSSSTARSASGGAKSETISKSK